MPHEVTDELAKIRGLFPAKKRIEVADGITVDVGVLNTGQMVKIGKLLGPALADLNRHTVRESVINHLEEFAGALAVAIDWPIDQVVELPSAIFFRLVNEVVDANVDYFKDKVAPVLDEIFGAAKRTKVAA